MTVNADTHSACYRGNIASGAVVMRSSHGPHNEDTVLCIVLIVSGALLTEVNNNGVSPATIYWWLTTFRAASKPECRPLGRHILDYPVLFKVTQNHPSDVHRMAQYVR